MAERKQSDGSLDDVQPYVVGYDSASAEGHLSDDEKDKGSRDISPGQSIAELDGVEKDILQDVVDEDRVIRTGPDASKYLLSLRDDGLVHPATKGRQARRQIQEAPSGSTTTSIVDHDCQIYQPACFRNIPSPPSPHRAPLKGRSRSSPLLSNDYSMKVIQ